MVQNSCKRRSDSIYRFKLERNSFSQKKSDNKVAFGLHFQGGVEFWWAEKGKSRFRGKKKNIIEEYCNFTDRERKGKSNLICLVQ